MKIISKRTATIIKDSPSFRLTLTNEFLDMSLDPEKDDKVQVMLVETNNGNKKIIIEKAI